MVTRTPDAKIERYPALDRDTLEGGASLMGVHELSAVLWRERELLELLLFKLEEEQLLLTAGKTRWLPFATREVEQVLERLRQSSLERSVEVAAVALEWGSNEDATLRELIAHAPSAAWKDNFTSHLQALGELASAIAALRDSNLTYLRAASRSAQETLAQFSTDGGGTYDATGSSGRSTDRAQFFDGEA
jgi:hypothetical protein